MKLRILFCQEQLRQLRQKALEMTIGNYLAVKDYYERRIEYYESQMK